MARICNNVVKKKTLYHILGRLGLCWTLKLDCTICALIFPDNWKIVLSTPARLIPSLKQTGDLFYDFQPKYQDVDFAMMPRTGITVLLACQAAQPCFSTEGTETGKQIG